MTIKSTLVTVRDAKSSYAYGQLAGAPLQASHSRGLFRANLPVDIPATAVVTKADIVLAPTTALTGSRTVTAQQLAASWQASKVTWDNQPGVTGTAVSTTVGAVAAGTEVRINVSTDAQAFIAGTATNYGWRISTSDATLFRVYGSGAEDFQPYLDLEYVEPGDPPVDLAPDGGAVSVAKPVLTFTVPGDVLSVRVIIDPAGNAVTPAWDSGEVPASGGMLDLSATTYPGLALAATTSWAAYAKTTLGWSDLSEWASFSRVAKPTPTITAPGATTGDATPPVTWTATGQTAWQVTLLDAAGKVLADSRRTAGTDTAWTPPTGLTKVGQVGTVRLRVWDNVDRVATSGDPVYAETTSTFTLVAAGAAPGVSGLTATQAGSSPVVRLGWSGAATDLKQIVRDDELLATIDGSLTEFYDYTAAPNHQHEYQVWPLTSTGVLSQVGPVLPVTPTCTALWLIDPDTGQAAMLLGQDSGSFDMTEQTVIHDVLGAPPVRRRSAILPPRGSLSGEVWDTDDLTADEVADALYAFKAGRPDHVYRLVVGDWNIPVTIGDVQVQPTPISSAIDRNYLASFSWWQTAAELPWDA